VERSSEHIRDTRHTEDVRWLVSNKLLDLKPNTYILSNAYRKYIWDIKQLHQVLGLDTSHDQELLNILGRIAQHTPEELIDLDHIYLRGMHSWRAARLVDCIHNKPWSD